MKREKRPKSKARKIVEGILLGLFIALCALVCTIEITGMISRKDNYNVPVILGKWQVCNVLSDSMEPKYKKGSAIIVEKQSVQSIIEAFDKGEEVDLTFADIYAGWMDVNDVEPPKGYLYWEHVAPVSAIMTHQMIKYEKQENGTYHFAVHGINPTDKEGYAYPINQYQVFTEKELLGRVVAVSNFLGVISGFVTEWYGLLVLLLLPSLYLIITSIIDVVKAFKEEDEGATGGGNVDKVVATEPIDSSNPLAELSEEDKERLKKEMLEELMNKRKGDN